MKKQTWLFILFLLTFTITVQAQCPFDEKNCTGKCGQFTDEDGDGYCDFTVITETLIKEESKVVIKEAPAKGFEQGKRPKRETNRETKEELGTPIESNSNTIDKIDDTLVKEITETQNAVNAEIPTEKPKAKPTVAFNLLPISFITIGIYLFSMFFVRIGKMKKITHRRIWNVILLLSFLGSGLLGLLLVAQMTYHFGISVFRDFVFWHVELGIIMVLIGIIHAFWHLDYYKNIVKKVRKFEGDK